MKRNKRLAGAKKLLALGLVLVFVCMATACNNKGTDKNNSGSMAGSGAQNDNGTGTNGNGTGTNGNGTGTNGTNGNTTPNTSTGNTTNNGVETIIPLQTVTPTTAAPFWMTQETLSAISLMMPQTVSAT